MYLRVYRGSVTGWFGYLACEAEQEVFQCGSSFSSPSPPVEITGSNFLLESNYDRDTTLIPGLTSRRIINRRKNPVADLRFEGDGLYTLICREGEYLIEDRNGKYLAFSRQNRCVFTMKRLSGGEVPAAVREANRMLDLEPYFEIMAEPEVSLPLVAVLASVPLLRFDYDRNRMMP